MPQNLGKSLAAFQPEQRARPRVEIDISARINMPNPDAGGTQGAFDDVAVMGGIWIVFGHFRSVLFRPLNHFRNLRSWLVRFTVIYALNDEAIVNVRKGFSSLAPS